MSKKLIEFMKFLYIHFTNIPNFSPDDYLHAYGKASDALLYSVLFLPQFVEIESSVFLKRNIVDEEQIRLEIANRKKPINLIESSYNFIEISYLFDCNSRDLSNDEEVLLANCIRDAWDGTLKLQYSNRNFIVEVINMDETETSLAIQFYEIRENAEVLSRPSRKTIIKE